MIIPSRRCKLLMRSLVLSGSMVLVDLSVWLEALRREGRLEIKLAVESLLEADEAMICEPVRLRVLGGARPEDREQVSQSLAFLPVRPCDGEDWNRATRLTWKCLDAGLAISPDHALVASMALHDGIRLFSSDEVFRRISPLAGLTLYAPGRGGVFQPA